MGGFLTGSNFSFLNNGAGSGGVTPNFAHGSFYDTTTQTAAINTPTAMKFNSTDAVATNGISVANNGSGNPTRLTVTQTGTYNVQFSAQVYRTSGGTAETIDIWLRANGTNVPNTDTVVNLNNNGVYVVAAWNFFIYLTSSQYVELMWAVTATTIQLTQAPENLSVPHPAIPSVIATMNRVA